MKIRRQLKKETRRQLKSHYLAAVCLTLCSGLCALVLAVGEWLCGLLFSVRYFTDFSETPQNYLDDRPALALMPLLLLGAFLFIRLLLFAPLGMGKKEWYLKLSAGEHMRFSEAFSWFSSPKRAWKAVWLAVSLHIRRALLWLLSSLPAIFLYLACLGADRRSQLFSISKLLLYIAFLLVFFVCQMIYLYLSGRYFLAEYLLILYGCKTRDAVRMSVIVMKEHKDALFSLRLSYIPYALANLLMIPALFTKPLIEGALAGYAKHFIESYERSKADAPAYSRSAVSQQTVEIPDLKQLGF